MKFQNRFQRTGRLVRPAALALVGSTLLAGSSFPALAATDEINLSFDVYASNIRAFKISIGMNIGKTSYTANTRIKSKGIVSFVSSAKINFDVEGKLDANSVLPGATMSGGRLESGSTRSTVARSSGRSSSPASASICFGFEARPTGQKRVPEPPAMIVTYVGCCGMRSVLPRWGA